MKHDIKDREIAIYQTLEGSIELIKEATEETVYANLEDISKLFERDKSVISRHIKNIYKQQELEKQATIALFATVQKEGTRMITREKEYYNLDMMCIIGSPNRKRLLNITIYI